MTCIRRSHVSVSVSAVCERLTPHKVRDTRLCNFRPDVAATSRMARDKYSWGYACGYKASD
jgi:hypothetical protein